MNRAIGSVKKTKIRYQGKIYKIHDHWSNILNTISLLEKEENDVERAIIIVQTIFGGNAPVTQSLVNKANDIIWAFIEKQDNENEPVYQDLVQDYHVYRMDILREFDIDIEKSPDLSWEDFLHLLSSLSKDSNMANLIQIRSTKMKDVPKDKRKEFKKIQERVALKKKHKEVEHKESIFDKHLRERKEAYNRKE